MADDRPLFAQREVELLSEEKRRRMLVNANGISRRALHDRVFPGSGSWCRTNSSDLRRGGGRGSGSNARSGGERVFARFTPGIVRTPELVVSGDALLLTGGE